MVEGVHAAGGAQFVAGQGGEHIGEGGSRGRDKEVEDAQARGFKSIGTPNRRPISTRRSWKRLSIMSACDGLFAVQEVGDVMLGEGLAREKGELAVTGVVDTQTRPIGCPRRWCSPSRNGGAPDPMASTGPVPVSRPVPLWASRPALYRPPGDV